MANCIVCGKALVLPYIRGEFVGRPDSRLNGIQFEAHAGCISMQFPFPGVQLPPRVSDPEMDAVEPDAKHDCAAA